MQDVGIWTMRSCAVLILGALAACEPASEQHMATIRSYCLDCHNEAEAVGNLVLESRDLAEVHQNPELWEKVVHKLRGGMMPPADAVLPDAVTLSRLVTYIETELDSAAAADPNPGRKSLHRINRTEYGNAIRDLLALDIDVTELLPGDSEAYGFDNIADVLGTDPSLMDRYVSAAWKITSAAMGDPEVASTVTTYTIPSDRSQIDHVEGLPFGTRGGMRVQHHFPVDGEYIIRPKLWRNTVDVIRGTESPHDLEISLDGARQSLTRFGGPEDETLAQVLPGSGGDEIERRFELRLAVTAGPHDVGVAFAKKSSSLRQEIIQPFGRDKYDPRIDVGQPDLLKIIIEGPVSVRGSGDSPSRQRIFSCYPVDDAAAAACAEEVLSTIARRAYRRPATDTEIARLLGLYANEREQGRSFEAGVQTALAYVLVSPQFLFRAEQDPEATAPGTIYRISDLEMASRLSFFIWSSIPDDELLDLAVAGRLQDPEVLQAQVERMLADERAERFASNFSGQWLYLRNLRATTPDLYTFPDFDDNLRQSLLRETELFFAAIVREDRPITELLDADFTFINERLARHYGIAGIYGDRFRRVQVDDERRRGLLGQGSILTLSSYPNRTSPVNRGNYVLVNILGTPPPSPPPDVPALKEEAGEVLTMRQRMEQHRADPACAGCHQLMDPIGLALESYDGVGRWRVEDAGAAVDANAGTIHVLREFGPVNGPVELRRAILSQPERFAGTVTQKLMTYALGRGLEHTDMPVVRRIVREAAANGYRFSSFITAIVTSDPFQMRTATSELDDPARSAHNGLLGASLAAAPPN